jgi:hypothetical protein
MAVVIVKLWWRPRWSLLAPDRASNPTLAKNPPIPEAQVKVAIPLDLAEVEVAPAGSWINFDQDCPGGYRVGSISYPPVFAQSP